MKIEVLKKFKSILGLAVALITTIFIIQIFSSYGDQLFTAFNLFSKKAIFFSALFYIFYFYTRSSAWYFLLAAFGHELPARDGLKIWFFGESARYIPGNVWSFASRVYLLSKKEVPKSLAAVTIALETAFLVLSAYFISIPSITSLILKKTDNPFSLIVLIVPVILLISLFLILITKSLRKSFGSIFKKDTNFAYILIAFLLNLSAWFFYGVANFNLLLGVAGSPDPKLIISISVFAWLIGYLSFVTPTGLGVRESALILLATPYIGPAKAGLLAILSRITLVATESINLLGWLSFDRPKMIKLDWKSLSKRLDLFILIILISSYIMVFCTLTILRHNSFASSFDLANMDQTVWNTIHGRIFEMSTDAGNTSRLGTHADFILILLSPLYLLWDNVRMLLIAQSVLLALGAIPVFLLAKKVIKNSFISICLVLIYLMNPGMQWTNVYDFHGVALAIPFLLFTFYFAYTKKWNYYWIFYFLSLITKEEISLFLVVMGFLIATFFGNRKVGIISMLIGLIWFPLMVFVAIPKYNTNNQHWAFNTWYSSTKDDLDKHDIVDLFSQIKNSSTQNGVFDYYQLLLKPYGYLPLLGLPWILMGIPELLINLLSSNWGMRTITFHYDSGIIPALTIATIFSLSYIGKGVNFVVEKKRFNSKIKTLTLPLVVIAVMIVAIKTDYYYAPLPLTPSCWCLVYRQSPDNDAFDQLLQTIPENASISASSEVRPHLTHRQNAFNLPKINPDTEYIAMIDESRTADGFAPHDFELSLIADPSFNQKYQLISHIGHYYLYQKNYSSANSQKTTLN